MTTLEDAALVCSRLSPVWIDPEHIVLDGRLMLTPEEEQNLVAEYGPEALIRYYAPRDPRLGPAQAPTPREYYYAGIGSRQTPQAVCDFMRAAATYLCGSGGIILRSGGAQGADQAFESGVPFPDRKQILVPWEGFEGRPLVHPVTDWAVSTAQEHFQGELPHNLRGIMGRNVMQVLGPSADFPWSSFVLCWTPDGKASGGTGMAMRIAKAKGIPVFNLKGHTPTEAWELVRRLAKVVPMPAAVRELEKGWNG
jgi:hypothetical protein